MDDHVNIRPMTGADVKEFFPQGLRDNCMGWAVELDGKLAAIAGVSFSKGAIVAFSKIREGVSASRKLVWRVALRLNKLITALPYDVRALTVNGRFLYALGWTCVDRRGNVEVFQWIR